MAEAVHPSCPPGGAVCCPAPYTAGPGSPAPSGGRSAGDPGPSGGPHVVLVQMPGPHQWEDGSEGDAARTPSPARGLLSEPQGSGVTPRAPLWPPSDAEPSAAAPPPPSHHHHQVALCGVSGGSPRPHRLQPASLPFHRSHSDTLAPPLAPPPPYAADARWLAPCGGSCCVFAACRPGDGARGREEGCCRRPWGKEPPYGCCACAAHGNALAGAPGNALGTMAAYCHARPIPAPLALTRDAGTMTTTTSAPPPAPAQLRDAAAQTEPLFPPLLPQPAHVFPRVSLAPPGKGDPHHPPPAFPGDPGRASPVREVRWDAEGMTWEVYGASVDPQELGGAIQRHLELQIREKLCGTAKGAGPGPGEGPAKGAESEKGEGGQRTKGRGVLGAIRKPSCCGRASTAVD